MSKDTKQLVVALIWAALFLVSMVGFTVLTYNPDVEYERPSCAQCL